LKRFSLTICALLFLGATSSAFLKYYGLCSEIDFDFLDFGTDRAQYLKGETVELWVTICNIGSQRIEANTLEVDFILILPNGSQINVGEKWNPLDIDPDMFELISVEWVVPQSAEGGFYDCQVSATHHPTLLAKNQTYHAVFEIVTSPSTVDLIAQIYVNGVFYYDRTWVDIGARNLNITYRVVNAGIQDASSFLVKFKFIGFGIKFIETISYDGLIQGGSIEYEKVFHVYLNEKYLVHLQVDYLGQVYESNETNNDSVVFIQTYSYPKIPQRFELSLLDGDWKTPSSQFKIEVWDISARPLDVLTSLAPQPEDHLILTTFGEFNDFDGNSVIDDEEIKHSILESLTEEVIKDYIQLIEEKLQAQDARVNPEDLNVNFWHHATWLMAFTLKSIEEYGLTSLENVVSISGISLIQVGPMAGGSMSFLGLGGYMEHEGGYIPIASIGNNLLNTIIATVGQVDLEIIDASDRTINKTINEIDGAIYEEKDLNNDGLLDDIITLPPGFNNYRIYVTPEPSSFPNSTVIVKEVSNNISLNIERTDVSNASTRIYCLFLADTTAPYIEEFFLIPQENIEPYQPTKVSAKVIDDQNIANVTLHYSTNNGTSWETLSMHFNQSSGYYETPIPGQPAGTIVKFRIIVYDNAGNKVTKTENEQYCTYIVVSEYVQPLTCIVTLGLLSIILCMCKHYATTRIRSYS
jgi:hypothetical protein